MARRTPLQDAVAAAEAEVRSLRQVVERARHTDKRRRNRSRSGSDDSETLLLALVAALSASPTNVYLCYRCVASVPAEAAPAGERRVLPDDVAARIACPAVITKAAALLAARPHFFLVNRAARLTAEAHVALWLAEVNAKGVAASSVQMAAVLRRQWPVAGRSAKTQRLLLRNGAFQCRSSHLESPISSSLGHFMEAAEHEGGYEPRLDTISGASFRPNWGPKSCPKRGPCFGDHFWFQKWEPVVN